MRNITVLLLAAVAFILTGCIGGADYHKDRPPYEYNEQSPEQQAALKKLADEARVNYEAKSKSSTH
ncbi:MAG: hypothetical protein COA92_01325 [Sulfurovum sp.]|nr:MAG: hypothetical protein COA92_01325 [Sulfurovum sp.]